MRSNAISLQGNARAPRRTGGFTLVEMLVVVSIVLVLAMLAGPAFTELTAQQRVQLAATDLFTSLLRARSEAIKQNTDVTLAPSGTWNAGWVVAAGGSNIDTHGATPNIAITGPALPITYRNSGRVSNAAEPQFTLSATQTSMQRCVKVRLSGEPVVTKAACS